MKAFKRFYIILGIPLLGALQCCDSESLNPLEFNDLANLKYITVDAHFCTASPSPAKQKIKYLFILDHSQSNKAGLNLFPADANNTDPIGSRRYGPINDFINNLAADPYSISSFYLINFNDGANAAFGLSPDYFDSDASDFKTIVTNDWIQASSGGTPFAPKPNDGGFTNYVDALNAAIQIITNDATNESGNPIKPVITSHYKIIFVSDGTPTVAAPLTSPSPTYTQTYDVPTLTAPAGDIKPLILQLINLKNLPNLSTYIASVTLNTVLYFNNTAYRTGPEGTKAATLLKEMATDGQGQYQEFSNAQPILYQIFSPPSFKIKNNLVDIFVENENATWWDDGRLMSDVDGDGLPDAIESSLGSNPNKADSDGNGVSDLVEYRTKDKPCNGAACTPSTRDDYSICAGFNPVLASDGSVTFDSTAKDGFNDCEKYVLGAKKDNFNSNGDLLPDFIKFKNQLPIIAGTSGAFLYPFDDNESNYMKVKLGLPTSISEQKVFPSFLKRITSLEHEESSNPDSECYHYTVQNVATLRPDNNIRVWLIENATLINDKPFFQSAQQSVLGQSTLTFAPQDFK